MTTNNQKTQQDLINLIVDAAENTGKNRVDAELMIKPKHEFRTWKDKELTETQLRVANLTGILPPVLRDISPIGMAEVLIEVNQKKRLQYNTFCLITSSDSEILKAYNKACSYGEDDKKGSFVYLSAIKVVVLQVNGKLTVKVTEKGGVGMGKNLMKSIHEKRTGTFGVKAGDIMPMIIEKSDDGKTHHTIDFNRAISNIELNDDAGDMEDIFASLMGSTTNVGNTLRVG